MDIIEKVDIHDCPVCGGAGLLEEERNAGYSVYCLDCGSHTVNVRYKTDDERLLSAQKAAELWNTGKVIKEGVGE